MRISLIFLLLPLYLLLVAQQPRQNCQFIASPWLQFDPFADSVLTGVKWVFSSVKSQCSGTVKTYLEDSLTHEYNWTIYRSGFPNCGIDVDANQLTGPWLSLQDLTKQPYDGDAFQCFYMHSDSSSTFLTLQKYGQDQLLYFRVDN